MTNLIAFDIDGTLTNSEVEQLYKILSRESDWITGILTRRPPFYRDEFIEGHNLSTEFSRSALFKSIKMKLIERNFDADSYLYVGNRATDELHSNIAGWKFIHIPPELHELAQIVRG